MVLDLPPAISPEQRLAIKSQYAQDRTDTDLARTIVNSNEIIERKAYLRELLWRWRDLPEVPRPWVGEPDHTPWWEEFA